MLDAGRAPERIAGLTLFFDHADEHRRYVLAETPSVVANPDPQLSLVLFRGEDSGGLLQLESTLAPTAAQLAAVERELALETGRPPVLARPDWRGGVVRVAGWLNTAELAPKLLVVGAPSLVGDPVSLIAARLDAAGAALAAASLKGNALPTVVMFELETLGLSGPLAVTAEADLHAIHDRLTAEGALTTPYGRARIAKTWESCARDNLIRVHVVDETGDVEGQRAEAMRRIGDDLIARMFSPFPPPERPPQLDDGTVAPIELSFRLTMRREELATSSRWDFRERRAVTIKHYAAASLIDLLGARSPADHITFVDLGDVRREVVVRAEPELSRLGLAAVEVDLGRDGEAVRQTVVLTDRQPEVRLPAAAEDGPLQYRVRARFDPSLTSAHDRETDWQESDSGLIAVSARRLFPPRVFTVIAGRVELDWLEHVEVLVEAPGEPPHTMLVSASAPSADVFLPAAGSRALTVTTRWNGRRDEPTRTEPPREVEDELLVLDSPFGNSIDVLLVPLPMADVATTVVELRTEHESFVHAKTESWDAPDRAPRRVGLRRLQGSPREFAYRVQLIREDGTVVDKPWTVTDRSTVVIGAEGPVDVRATEVVLLGGGPATRGSFAVELVLTAGAHHAQALLEGARDTATLAVAVPEGDPGPVLIAREFLNSGDVRETRWEDPEALVVLPLVPIETH